MFSLVPCSLESNFLKDKGARALAEALKANKSLTQVDLAHNDISNRAAQPLNGRVVRFTPGDATSDSSG